ncbi:hypothetical protein FRC02_005175 [Tulasnella sp. 418]|nr:hypothetical protein FRC02_005175 [Tulasnella sp. 418]
MVKQHFTKFYNDHIVQRVVHVPMEPMANHHHLPEELQVDAWREKKKKNNQYSYRRIDGDGLFPTSLCALNPHSQTGHCLHPNQKRVLTLREYARSQGFPDDFEFYSVKGVNPMFRQVGNAVPIPLGGALGRELGKAVAEELYRNMGDVMEWN